MTNDSTLDLSTNQTDAPSSALPYGARLDQQTIQTVPSVVGVMPGHRPFSKPTPRAAVIPDSNAIIGLIDLLIEHSGLTQAEVARRLNIRPQTIDQYRRRTINPTLKWFTRFAAVCGAKVTVEF